MAEDNFRHIMYEHYVLRTDAPDAVGFHMMLLQNLQSVLNIVRTDYDIGRIAV